jgi:hypothetical protein
MKIREIVDMLSVPFWMFLTFYFYNIEDKTPLEYLFYGFSLTGFIVDSVLTASLLRGHCRKVCKSKIINSK